MSLGRKYCCRLFSAVTAIGGTTLLASQYIASTIKKNGTQLLNEILDSDVTLKNVTTTVTMPFLPDPMSFTLERINFTLRQTLAEPVTKHLNELPETASEHTRYAVLTAGTIILALTAGILYACTKNSPSPTPEMVPDNEEELLVEESPGSIALQPR